MHTKESVAFDARKWAAKFWSSYSAYSLLDNIFMDPYAVQKLVPLPDACQDLPEEERKRIHITLQESTARDLAKILREESALMMMAAAAYYRAILKDFLKVALIWYPAKMSLLKEDFKGDPKTISVVGEIPDPDNASPLEAEALAEKINCRSHKEGFEVIEALAGRTLPMDLKSSVEDIFFLSEQMVQEEETEDLGRQKLLWVFSTLPSKLLASLEELCRHLDLPFTSTAKHDLAAA